MGEENTGAGESQESTENQSEEKEQNDTGSGEGESESNEEKEDGADGDEADDDEGDDDEEPAVRKKTAKDYIIERKNKKIEKLKKKENDDEGESESDDDDISPEDEKVVDKIIQKRYGDKFAKLDESEDRSELNSFLSENPDFKTYEKKIWKFWQHPSRNHLPVSSVAYEVAGKALLKIGAQRGQQANEKAKKTSSGGGSGRNAGGKVDYSSMSDADFQKHVEEVKRKQA